MTCRPSKSGYTEPFALLVARLAYEGDGGPELAYRFERSGKEGRLDRLMQAGRPPIVPTPVGWRL